MTQPPFSIQSFSPDDIRDTHPELKIGLLATVNAQGLPHVTMLSSLMACGPQQLCFGQFTEGFSKKHIIDNPKTGFMIMSLDRQLWRGQAHFTQAAKQGVDYDFYNLVPMFRYNAYFGIHTVYYLDLLGHTGKQPLPMNRVILAAVQTMLARSFADQKSSKFVLNPWTRAFFNKLDNLKFLAHVDADGYPSIIPAIQAQTLDPQHIAFSTSIYQEELGAIPVRANLAVFGLALTMEDILLRGVFQGFRRLNGIRVGVVEIDWVYNPMPPVPGQIYPEVSLGPISEF